MRVVGLNQECASVTEPELSATPTGTVEVGAGQASVGEMGEVVPLIEQIRTRAAAIAREEVARTLRRLSSDAEVAARLDAMAGAIVSKLLHQPSTRLRRAASEGGAGEAVVAAAKEIFQVGSEIPAPRRNMA